MDTVTILLFHSIATDAKQWMGYKCDVSKRHYSKIAKIPSEMDNKILPVKTGIWNPGNLAYYIPNYKYVKWSFS